jgi:hypothetical protein
VPEPSAFEIQMAIEKLERYNSLGIDQIPAGGNKICSEINKHITSIWNKGKLPQQWTESINCTYL